MPPPPQPLMLSLPGVQGSESEVANQLMLSFVQQNKTCSRCGGNLALRKRPMSEGTPGVAYIVRCSRCRNVEAVPGCT